MRGRNGGLLILDETIRIFDGLKNAVRYSGRAPGKIREVRHGDIE